MSSRRFQAAGRSTSNRISGRIWPDTRQCSCTSAVPAIALAVMMENSYPVRLRRSGQFNLGLTRISLDGGFQVFELRSVLRLGVQHGEQTQRNYHDANTLK